MIDPGVPSTEFQSLSNRLMTVENELEMVAETMAFQMTQLKQQTMEMKRAVETQTNMTADMLEVFDSAKHAVKFIVLSGKVALWFAKIGGAMATIWILVKAAGKAIALFFLSGVNKP